MTNFVTRWLARRLMHRLTKRVVGRRPADYLVGSADDPYMHRWWVIPRNALFNIYLHRIVHDDDDRALHDHPWWSISLCLKGELGEIYAVDQKGGDLPVERSRMLQVGDIVVRGARFSHRLFLPRLPDSSGEAWTLFITGPRIREWGFWCQNNETRRWVHWKDFTARNDSSRIGRGCE